MVGRSDGAAPDFYRIAVEHSTVALVIVGADGVVRYHTPEAGRMLRGVGASLIGRPLHLGFAAEARTTVDAYLGNLSAAAPGRSSFLELSCVLADGDERWIEITGVNLLGAPDVGGIVLNLSDRTEHHRALAQLMVDPMTGLGNRGAAERRLAMAEPVIAMVIDLDKFKAVNDMHGHGAGDQVVMAVGRRLRDLFRITGLVCRFGGDEFIVILPESARDRAWELAETALASIRAPIGASALRVTASIGIASSKHSDGDAVLGRADAAMYEAKRSGGGTVLAAGDEADEWELRRRVAPDALESSMRREAKLKTELARLADENRIDKRTGLLSAEAFEADIVGIETVARQEGRRYALALCDIDYFGPFNNHYGYSNANAVLRSTADALKSACRPGDLVYRYGGEELVAVLLDTELDDAAALGERLRRSVEALDIVHENRPEPHRVTISVGVAAFELEHHDDYRDVFDTANHRLRSAKDGGRNRVDPAAVTKTPPTSRTPPSAGRERTRGDGCP